jgi:uncharacterized glyoxalase superfamily protein PhnB
MPRTIPSTPNNYHTATPYLMVTEAGKLIAFLETVFGAQVSERIVRPDGKIVHADVRIGDSTIMVADASDDWAPMPGAIYLYVNNTDTTYQQAIQAGATSLMVPADQFHGDRMAAVKDLVGNVWWIVTHIEDVSPEDLQKRADAQLRQ